MGGRPRGRPHPLRRRLRPERRPPVGQQPVHGRPRRLDGLPARPRLRDPALRRVRLRRGPSSPPSGAGGAGSRWAAAAGLLLGAAALVQVQLLLPIPFAFAATALVVAARDPARRGRALVALAVTGGLALLLAAPWLVETADTIRQNGGVALDSSDQLEPAQFGFWSYPRQFGLLLPFGAARRGRRPALPAAPRRPAARSASPGRGDPRLPGGGRPPRHVVGRPVRPRRALRPGVAARGRPAAPAAVADRVAAAGHPRRDRAGHRQRSTCCSAGGRAGWSPPSWSSRSSPSVPATYATALAGGPVVDAGRLRDARPRGRPGARTSTRCSGARAPRDRAGARGLVGAGPGSRRACRSSPSCRPATPSWPSTRPSSPGPRRRSGAPPSSRRGRATSASLAAVGRPVRRAADRDPARRRPVVARRALPRPRSAGADPGAAPGGRIVEGNGWDAVDLAEAASASSCPPRAAGPLRRGRPGRHARRRRGACGEPSPRRACRAGRRRRGRPLAGRHRHPGRAPTPGVAGPPR